jgi:hypothetical protein
VSNALIQQFVQETGVPWPVGSGASSVGSAYQVAETPILYVINPAGNVALTMLSPTNVATLKSTIDSLEGAPVHLFVQGTDHALWSKHYQSGSGWSSWQSLGGSLTASPAATSPTSGVIDVFVRGSDNGIWQRTYNNGGWGTWKSIGGPNCSLKMNS